MKIGQKIQFIFSVASIAYGVNCYADYYNPNLSTLNQVTPYSFNANPSLPTLNPAFTPLQPPAQSPIPPPQPLSGTIKPLKTNPITSGFAQYGYNDASTPSINPTVLPPPPPKPKGYPPQPFSTTQPVTTNPVPSIIQNQAGYNDRSSPTMATQLYIPQVNKKEKNNQPLPKTIPLDQTNGAPRVTYPLTAGYIDQSMPTATMSELAPHATTVATENPNYIAPTTTATSNQTSANNGITASNNQSSSQTSAATENASQSNEKNSTSENTSNQNGSNNNTVPVNDLTVAAGATANPNGTNASGGSSTGGAGSNTSGSSGGTGGGAAGSNTSSGSGGSAGTNTSGSSGSSSGASSSQTTKKTTASDAAKNIQTCTPGSYSITSPIRPVVNGNVYAAGGINNNPPIVTYTVNGMVNGKCSVSIAQSSVTPAAVTPGGAVSNTVSPAATLSQCQLSSNSLNTLANRVTQSATQYGIPVNSQNDYANSALNSQCNSFLIVNGASVPFKNYSGTPGIP